MASALDQHRGPRDEDRADLLFSHRKCGILLPVGKQNGARMQGAGLGNRQPRIIGRFFDLKADLR